jgi:hypothetical protein
MADVGVDLDPQIGGALDIIKFAAEYRLKITKDGTTGEDELVIDGRVGQSRIYQYDTESLAVAFITDGKQAPRTGLFNTFKSACVEAGMTPTQIGDAEGVFTFDPSNPKQAKVAIRGIRARAKRQVSPEQAAAGAARLAGIRQSTQRLRNSQQEASV